MNPALRIVVVAQEPPAPESAYEKLRKCAMDKSLHLVEGLVSLQQSLHCGAHCGSCLPEVKRLVHAALNASAVAA